MSTTEAAPVDESADEPHFTAKEVAQRLKLSPKYIYRAVDTGDLECQRYGQAVRFTRSQIRAFIVKHSKKQVDLDVMLIIQQKMHITTSRLGTRGHGSPNESK